MTRQSSFGTCQVCGTRSSKAAMTAHLRKCLPRAGDGATVDGLLIRIEAMGAPMYWMDCAVRCDAKLKQLDRLLRRTWLECCGHLSAFTAGSRDPIGMSVLIEKALMSAENRLAYEYDFGSTTALVISHSGQIGAVLEHPVRVVARNEPIIWACDVCGEPATAICTQCVYDDRGFCCAKHATKHSCGTDMLLPVVNSPRMGVCGYTGEG